MIKLESRKETTQSREKLAEQLYVKEKHKIDERTQKLLRKAEEHSKRYPSSHLKRIRDINLDGIRKLGEAKLRSDKAIFHRDKHVMTLKDAAFLYKRLSAEVNARGEVVRKQMEEKSQRCPGPCRCCYIVEEFPRRTSQMLSCFKRETEERTKERVALSKTSQTQATKPTKDEPIPVFDKESGRFSFGDKESKFRRNSLQYKFVEFLYDNPNELKSYEDIGCHIGIIDRMVEKYPRFAKRAEEIEELGEEGIANLLRKLGNAGASALAPLKKKINDIASEVKRKLGLPKKDESLFFCNNGYMMIRKDTKNIPAE